MSSENGEKKVLPRLDNDQVSGLSNRISEIPKQAVWAQISFG